MNRAIPIAIGLLLVRGSLGVLNPEGVKCGQKRCSTVEYCSPYDTHCRPCSEACDAKSRNYQPSECASDCQEYLHDQRYVLRSETDGYEELRGQVESLRCLATVSITITCLCLLAICYLLGRIFVRWKKIGDVFRQASSRNWIKKATKNNNNNNKVQDDAELGTAKQNGLKLTMPTISASVAQTRIASSGSANGNSSGSCDTTANGNGNGTPNTSSTTLSRRHPSEDTTLDYAYDNPAMTPSPEAAQLRTKRESSF